MVQVGVSLYMVILSYSVNGVFAGFFIPGLNRYLSRLHSPQCPETTEERFTNLFVSEKSINRLTTSRQFQETFKVGRVMQKFPFPGTCSRRVEYSSNALSMCDSDQSESGTKNRFNQCCETELSITIPETVTSLFSGEPSRVIHLSTSYQLLHEARCVKPKSICSTGLCQLAYRIQWVLVKQSNQQTFVPVSVGNHCYCSFQ